MKDNKDILGDILDVVGGDQSVTYIAFVQDHSGSMKNILPGTNNQTKADMAKTNFNEYIVTLKKESAEDMETLVTLIEFDDTIRCTDHKLIKEVEPMSGYWTGGMTALYDAIAKSIGELSRAMAKDTRTNKAALVIIQTDGDENYSQEYKGRDGQKKLQKYISELEETGLWTFVFLGEDIDEKLAEDIGMTPKNFMKTEATGQSYAMTGSIVQDGLSKYYGDRKRGMTQSKAFFDKDEDDKNETGPGDGS